MAWVCRIHFEMDPLLVKELAELASPLTIYIVSSPLTGKSAHFKYQDAVNMREWLGNGGQAGAQTDSYTITKVPLLEVSDYLSEKLIKSKARYSDIEKATYLDYLPQEALELISDPDKRSTMREKYTEVKGRSRKRPRTD